MCRWASPLWLWRCVTYRWFSQIKLTFIGLIFLLCQGCLLFSLFPRCSMLRSENPNFYATMHTELPWDREAVFTRVLLHEKNKKAAFHKIDIFHTVSLGIGKSFAASSLAILQKLCPGSSVEKRLQSLSSSFLEYCRAASSAFSNGWVLVLVLWASMICKTSPHWIFPGGIASA